MASLKPIFWIILLIATTEGESSCIFKMNCFTFCVHATRFVVISSFQLFIYNLLYLIRTCIIMGHTAQRTQVVKRIMLHICRNYSQPLLKESQHGIVFYISIASY